MESSNLINEGLTLMVFGMGFVFVFLTLLIFATGLMSRLVGKYIPEPAPAAPRASRAAAVAAPDEGQLVAVISAAIKQYRARHPR
ncbi:MAG: OadG family transporter subunit [Halopseudomonas sp.]